MAKPDNQYQELARDAADRLRRDRDLAEQLTLLPDEAPAAEEETAIGRPKGAKNKGSSQLRDWLAARGYRMPEDVIAEMAGLDARADAIELAMAKTERILAWAADGAAKERVGSGDAAKTVEWVPTGGQRLETFKTIFAIQLRAAEALLPYGTPKAAGNEAPAPITHIVLPGAPSRPDPASSARDVTPATRSLEHMPAWQRQIVENQQVSEADPDGSDGEARTERVKR